MNQKKGLKGLDDHFKFRCHSGVACFTNCCADVAIYLTPFDVVRMTTALGMTSTDFLDQYTLSLRGPKPIIPLICLKMRDDERKTCPMVAEDGCKVYDSRPWSCRMFPLDLVGKQDFHILDLGGLCKGLDEDWDQTIKDYLVEQGVVLSSELDAEYQAITDHPKMAELDVNNPQIAKMIYLACYDLDRFKEFVFESSFLQKVKIPAGRLEVAKDNKVELLRLGMDWVRFGLFAEKTLALQDEIVDQMKQDGDQDDGE